MLTSKERGLLKNPEVPLINNIFLAYSGRSAAWVYEEAVCQLRLTTEPV